MRHVSLSPFASAGPHSMVSRSAGEARVDLCPGSSKLRDVNSIWGRENGEEGEAYVYRWEDLFILDCERGFFRF